MAEERHVDDDAELDNLVRDFFSEEPTRDDKLTATDVKQPSPLNDQVVNMYSQAHGHRDTLISYYKNYTACFTITVLALVIAQGVVRALTDRDSFEIMPQWTLNILITGMFGQFLVLLKIVTKNAWDFKTFFEHHEHSNDSRGRGQSGRSPAGSDKTAV